MNLYNVFNQIVILFLILLVGVVTKKLKVVRDSFTKDLTDFILTIALPAQIISSMNYDFSPDKLRTASGLLVICMILYIISIGFAILVTRLLKIEGSAKNIYRFALVFSNVGFMGYPVVNAVYGSEGVFYTAIYNLPFNLLVWTVGLILIGGGGREKLNLKVILNPGVVAVLIGLTLFIFSIKLPGPIESTIEMIGSSTTPLSMILVGLILADSSLKKVFSSPMVFVISFLRLIAIPFLYIVILKPFVTNPLILGIPVVIAAMPAAANTAILASKYDGNVYLASQSVFISTLLSIVTIPLIVFILGIV